MPALTERCQTIHPGDCLPPIHTSVDMRPWLAAALLALAVIREGHQHLSLELMPQLQQAIVKHHMRTCWKCA
eukprot:scaffold35960_cov20-Prasinocladus_malaysianus.AAC.1